MLPTVPERTHASQAASGLLKIQQIDTGLVFERNAADAGEAVRNGGFTYAPHDTPSIPELLAAMSRSELLSLLPGDRADDSNEWIVKQLVPLVESGAVSLPGEE